MSDFPIISEPPLQADDTQPLPAYPDNPWDEFWRRVTALEQHQQELRAAITPRGAATLKHRVVRLDQVRSDMNEFLAVIGALKATHTTHGERIGQVKLLEQLIRDALRDLEYDATDGIPF